MRKIVTCYLINHFKCMGCWIIESVDDDCSLERALLVVHSNDDKLTANLNIGDVTQTVLFMEYRLHVSRVCSVDYVQDIIT